MSTHFKESLFAIIISQYYPGSLVVCFLSPLQIVTKAPNCKRGSKQHLKRNSSHFNTLQLIIMFHFCSNRQTSYYVTVLRKK